MQGTEYALFSSGNTTEYAANVNLQNYHYVDFGAQYGMTDFLNVGIKGGYCSGSTFDHYTLKDLVSRFYRIEPYYFVDLKSELRVKKDWLISFKAHIVPRYKVMYESSSDPKVFEFKNRYFETTTPYSEGIQ